MEAFASNPNPATGPEAPSVRAGRFTPEAVLRLQLKEEGRLNSGAQTIGGYLRELLVTLFQDRDEFSGKRPFGASGWVSDLEVPLVEAGFIDGEMDEDGILTYIDHTAFDNLIERAIKHVFTAYE